MSGFKFSNFQTSPMMIRGASWQTVEHFFQAMKSNDLAEQKQIRDLPRPGAAKRAGRKVTLRQDWPKVKEEIMMEALRAKFSIPDFKSSLLSTGVETIVENNTWHDNEWGACSCQRCKNKPSRNKLGKLLMKLRQELRQ